MAVDHQGLVALEPEAVTGTHRLHLCHQRAMFCPFVDRERRQQRAVCDFRQVLGFLRAAGAAGQSGSSENGGGLAITPRLAGAAALLGPAPGPTTQPTPRGTVVLSAAAGMRV